MFDPPRTPKGAFASQPDPGAASSYASSFRDDAWRYMTVRTAPTIIPSSISIPLPLQPQTEQSSQTAPFAFGPSAPGTISPQDLLAPSSSSTSTSLPPSTSSIAAASSFATPLNVSDSFQGSAFNASIFGEQHPQGYSSHLFDPFFASAFDPSASGTTLCRSLTASPVQFEVDQLRTPVARHFAPPFQASASTYNPFAGPSSAMVGDRMSVSPFPAPKSPMPFPVTPSPQPTYGMSDVVVAEPHIIQPSQDPTLPLLDSGSELYISTPQSKSRPILRTSQSHSGTYTGASPAPIRSRWPVGLDLGAGAGTEAQDRRPGSAGPGAGLGSILPPTLTPTTVLANTFAAPAPTLPHSSEREDKLHYDCHAQVTGSASPHAGPSISVTPGHAAELSDTASLGLDFGAGAVPEHPLESSPTSVLSTHNADTSIQQGSALTALDSGSTSSSASVTPTGRSPISEHSDDPHAHVTDLAPGHVRAGNNNDGRTTSSSALGSPGGAVGPALDGSAGPAATDVSSVGHAPSTVPINGPIGSKAFSTGIASASTTQLIPGANLTSSVNFCTTAPLSLPPTQTPVSRDDYHIVGPLSTRHTHSTIAPISASAATGATVTHPPPSNARPAPVQGLGDSAGPTASAASSGSRVPLSSSLSALGPRDGGINKTVHPPPIQTITTVHPPAPAYPHPLVHPYNLPQTQAASSSSSSYPFASSAPAQSGWLNRQPSHTHIHPPPPPNAYSTPLIGNLELSSQFSSPPLEVAPQLPRYTHTPFQGYASLPPPPDLQRSASHSHQHHAHTRSQPNILYPYHPYALAAMKAKLEEPILAPGELPAPRPSNSYAALIGEALLASDPPHQLYVSEISDMIKRRYPYYRQNPSKVYNGVRHQTSMCPAFVKLGRPFGEQSGGAHKWGIRVGYESFFRSGGYHPPTTTPPPAKSRSTSTTGKAKSTAQSKRLAIGIGSPEDYRGKKQLHEPFSPSTGHGGPSIGMAYDGTAKGTWVAEPDSAETATTSSPPMPYTPTPSFQNPHPQSQSNGAQATPLFTHRPHVNPPLPFSASSQGLPPPNGLSSSLPAPGYYYVPLGHGHPSHPVHPVQHSHLQSHGHGQSLSYTPQTQYWQSPPILPYPGPAPQSVSYSSYHSNSASQGNHPAASPSPATQYIPTPIAQPHAQLQNIQYASSPEGNGPGAGPDVGSKFAPQSFGSNYSGSGLYHYPNSDDEEGRFRPSTGHGYVNGKSTMQVGSPDSIRSHLHHQRSSPGLV